MPCPVMTASIRAWISEGGPVSVHACHHRLRVLAGVSQERMARKPRGKQGCWGWRGWWDGARSPSGQGPTRWHPGVRVGRTIGPSRVRRRS